MARALHLPLLVVLAFVTVAPALAAPPTATPPAEAEAKQRLETSPRHGEYVDVPMPGGRPVRAYVVFPERKEKAPVVIVIHEIYGLSDWIKSVTDQLAADGFIAIAPDFLSGADGGGTDSLKGRDEITKAVRGVTPERAAAVVNAARDFGAKLPAAGATYATIGFCWGGARSFEYAVADPALSAAVVYYGTSPADASSYDKIKAPVLGLYGEDDARVNATVPTATDAMTKLGKPYVPHFFKGAGHGFLRGQDGRDGANRKAAEEAWPLTIEFLRKNLK